ncbi:hypothetical protein GF386_06800 [Candidatus Pacearchaeota archaeon]|nr:hypothetical protein [Candidatus Pacearchaeota archaeon]
MANQDSFVSFGDEEEFVKGLVSTQIGETPFYTNNSNPRNINLNKSQSQNVVFWVNATGTGSYEFFAYANVTENMGISNLTEKVNITIVPLSNIFVSLFYPNNSQNFYSDYISQFNFSFSISDGTIDSCELWGNWSGGWHKNQTIVNPPSDVEINFSGVNLSYYQYYIWNVKCNDTEGRSAWNDTNYVFSTFIPPEKPVLINITQTDKDGSGNVTLFWNYSNYSFGYRIYYNASMRGNFSLLNETGDLNLTDTSFYGKRRFYKISAWNPGGENFSDDYFGRHVYYLRHNQNTRNWIGFPTNFSYLKTANDTLYDMTNVTTVTMWNATPQLRVTCNFYSCPDSFECTSTSCNFDIKNGTGYEVNLNGSAPSEVNWSGVGIVYDKANVSLIKNLTDFGKNWISVYCNTSLNSAIGLLNNISKADAVTRWDSSAQTSRGLIHSPFPWADYLGTNFSMIMEEGYEVSVNQTMFWKQN